MLKENDTLASHTTALNKLRDVCIVLCSEGLSTQPKLVVCLETELAKPHQMLSWQSVTAHSALTSAWTHCIFLHFRCSQYFKLICSIKTLKTLLADTQKKIQFFHLFSAMKQTPAKVAAELRSPQRGNNLGWARGAAQLPSVPAEGEWHCKRHPIPLPMNSATCFILYSGFLTVRVSQAWVKI